MSILAECADLRAQVRSTAPECRKLGSRRPVQFMDHLAVRFREGRISIADFDELHDWLASDPDVPHGKWFKRFTLAGEGELPKTFLEPGMAAHGQEVE